MDEELKAYLDAMETRLTERINATYAALGEVVARMNNQHERLLNDLTGLRGDFQNTKGFLLNDAATRGRQWLDLEDRVTKLERGGK